MRRSLVIAVLFFLSTAVYSTRSAIAQVRPDPDEQIHPGQAQSIENVKALEAERRVSRQAWLSGKQIPYRVRQRDGSTVQLMGALNDRPHYYTSLNEFSAGVTGTSLLYPDQRLGLNITGQNMTIGLWDAGHALKTHQEFASRITIRDVSEDDDHSTHVAGTLVASGIVTGVRGMAYEADLLSYDWDNDAEEMSDEAGKGLLVSNHSYGLIAGWYYGDIEDDGDKWYWFGDPDVSTAEDYAFGFYTREAALFDNVTFAYPYYLPVVAAGNDREDDGPRTGTYRGLNQQGDWIDYTVGERPVSPDGDEGGFDSIAGSALAKNVLTVGSIGINRNTGNPFLSGFSSFGPTDDGRIKPDLVGIGESVYSTRLTGPKKDQNYGTSSGTSMATPNISGSLLLLQQVYFQLRGHYMRAATLKGLAIHTARDLGTPGPDYSYGWGLLDMESAVERITNSLSDELVLYEGSLADEKPFRKSLTANLGGPVRITLSWTDRAASERLPALDENAIVLLNDLDLRLTSDSTGIEYFPYILDPATPGSPATRGDNRVDPVEQIYVDDLPVGTYTLTVSHKNNLVAGAPQAFSLVTTGLSDTPLVVSVQQLDAETTVDHVTLNWTTAFERDEGTFSINRIPISIDGNNQKVYGTSVPVGNLSSRGGPRAGSTYQLTDEGILSGFYLYRLTYSTVDKDVVVRELEVNVLPPESFASVSNYPNPFSDRTTLVLDIPDNRRILVEVYDVLGRLTVTLYDGSMQAGRHPFEVDAGGWTDGLYFVRITSQSETLTHKIVVVR